TAHFFHPHRQQALALLAQHTHGTIVEHQRAAGLQLTGKPALTRRLWLLMRPQEGTDVIALRQTQSRVFNPSTHNYRICTGTRSNARGAYLGDHAATSQHAATASHLLKASIIGGNFRSELSIGV